MQIVSFSFFNIRVDSLIISKYLLNWESYGIVVMSNLQTFNFCDKIYGDIYANGNKKKTVLRLGPSVPLECLCVTV